MRARATLRPHSAVRRAFSPNDHSSESTEFPSLHTCELIHFPHLAFFLSLSHQRAVILSGERGQSKRTTPPQAPTLFMASLSPSSVGNIICPVVHCTIQCLLLLAQCTPFSQFNGQIKHRGKEEEGKERRLFTSSLRAACERE